MENDKETNDLVINCDDDIGPTKSLDEEVVLCSGEAIGHEIADDDDEQGEKELDTIHHDLTELVDKLNTFIAEQDDFYEFGSFCGGDDASELDSQKEDEDISEKQDGPQEKELIKQKYQKVFNPEDIYVCDGENPPEVNWDTLAPFIQTVVGDLQRIKQLNQMTHSVMERIRNLTESSIEGNATGNDIED